MPTALHTQRSSWLHPTNSQGYKLRNCSLVQEQAKVVPKAKAEASLQLGHLVFLIRTRSSGSRSCSRQRMWLKFVTRLVCAFPSQEPGRMSRTMYELVGIATGFQFIINRPSFATADPWDTMPTIYVCDVLRKNGTFSKP